MIIEHRRMSRWRMGLVLVALCAACTKPNPKSCQDGTCTDPAFPFCDLDGALEGEAETCIAVACTANEFVACRADDALVCNAAGADYDLLQCARGCDPMAGCRLCDPNETVCENGTVQTCDANGAVVASHSCPLGCYENQPRCREVKPSNNLGAYLDMVTDPPDLDLAAAEFYTDTGVVEVGPQTVTVPNFLMNLTGNGASVRVFVVGSLKLDSGSVLVNGDPRAYPGPAFAIVSRGDITITGELLVASRAGGGALGCLPAGKGTARDDGNGRVLTSGGGGGGNATNGAPGGSIVGDTAAGGINDVASGTPALVPLRGGCAGGYLESSTPATFHNGGGAIQLTSGTMIDIDGTIDVRGTVGMFDRFDQTNGFMVGGGGAGGSILIEAPQVMLRGDAKLLATGGDGGQACATPSTLCGAGGPGATPTMPAGKGADVNAAAGANVILTSGGGGGGLGRVRINTATGLYTKANTAVEAASVTTGTIGTR